MLTLLPGRVSQSASLSAAIFAAVCLASRLASPLHAFATLAAALLVFALWPVLRNNIKVSTRLFQPLAPSLGYNCCTL